MPKISRFGGHTNAGITERAAGFREDTSAIRASAQDIGASFLGDEGTPFTSEELESAASAELPFDPGLLSVADVLALMADCSEAERAQVVAAELAGKARKGITG